MGARLCVVIASRAASMTMVIGPVPWRSLRPLRAPGAPRGEGAPPCAARCRGGALSARAGPAA
eukprot:8298337-Lingulodinium_polyedra.AAC.1